MPASYPKIIANAIHHSDPVVKTRHPLSIYPQIATSNRHERCIRFMGVKIWNSLPAYLSSPLTLSCFKKKLKQCLLNIEEYKAEN